jgi:hypothetical protein
MDYLMKKLNDRFGDLTQNFDLDDWRKCRDAEYWKSDQMTNPFDRISHKIRCVENYLIIRDSQKLSR